MHSYIHAYSTCIAYIHKYWHLMSVSNISSHYITHIFTFKYVHTCELITYIHTQIQYITWHYDTYMHRSHTCIRTRIYLHHITFTIHYFVKQFITWHYIRHIHSYKHSVHTYINTKTPLGIHTHASHHATSYHFPSDDIHYITVHHIYTYIHHIHTYIIWNHITSQHIISLYITYIRQSHTYAH